MAIKHIRGNRQKDDYIIITCTCGWEQAAGRFSGDIRIIWLEHVIDALQDEMREDES